MTTPLLKIHHVDWWQGFYTGADIYTGIVDQATRGRMQITLDPDSPDVILSSMFGGEKMQNWQDSKGRKSLHFHYVGEPRSLFPHVASADWIWCFSDGDNSSAVPVWCQDFYQYARDRHLVVPVPQPLSTIPFESRTEYCGFLARHDNSGMRSQLLRTLDKHSNVARFGPFQNNRTSVALSGHGPLMRWTKLSVYNRCRFALTAENSSEVDYFTEKVPDALVGGCIPIWYGHESGRNGSPFNPDRYIDATNMSPRQLLEEVKRLDVKEHWEEMVSKPLLRDKLPDPEKWAEKIRIILTDRGFDV